MAKAIEVIKLVLQFGEQAAELFVWVWRLATGPNSDAKQALYDMLDKPTREAVIKILGDTKLAQANGALDEALKAFGG
jgi:hypothetical protein